jgi:signal transduction histidine kinase
VTSDPIPSAVVDRLLAYTTDLELEVDRLRRQREFVERAAGSAAARVLKLCEASAGEAPPALVVDVAATAKGLLDVVRDLHDSRGYHPAHDQVVAVAVRPLAEQAFRWQQRLTGVTGVDLRLDLQPDHLEWFPARLRHILDNLFAHALRHHDRGAADRWVSLGVRAVSGRYELRISDNGVGPPPDIDRRVHNLRYPPAWGDGIELGAELAIVRRLIEQSGGSIRVSGAEGRGTEFVLTLPRYDLLDYLE